MNRAVRGPTFVSSTRLFATTLAMALAFPSPARAQPTEAPPATTSGRIIGPTGAPIAGARIRLADDGDDRAITSDRDGRFSVTAPIGATLVIEHEGDETAI